MKKYTLMLVTLFLTLLANNAYSEDKNTVTKALFMDNNSAVGISCSSKDGEVDCFCTGGCRRTQSSCSCTGITSGGLQEMLLDTKALDTKLADGTDTKLAEKTSALRAELAVEKKVEAWGKLGFGKGGDMVVFLKPSECDALGGDVDYHQWCGTRLKCVVGDRAICIDEMDTALN